MRTWNRTGEIRRRAVRHDVGAEAFDFVAEFADPFPTVSSASSPASRSRTTSRSWTGKHADAPQRRPLERPRPRRGAGRSSAWRCRRVRCRPNGVAYGPSGRIYAYWPSCWSGGGPNPRYMSPSCCGHLRRRATADRGARGLPLSVFMAVSTPWPPPGHDRAHLRPKPEKRREFVALMEDPERSAGGRGASSGTTPSSCSRGG